jgi:hypothetical protein
MAQQACGHLFSPLLWDLGFSFEDRVRGAQSSHRCSPELCREGAAISKWGIVIGRIMNVQIDGNTTFLTLQLKRSKNASCGRSGNAAI